MQCALVFASAILLSSTAVAQQATYVSPTSVRGGPLRGSDLAMDATPVTDGNPATFLYLAGLDGVRNGNGVFIDSGTQYFLNYHINPAAKLFSIEFTVDVDSSVGSDALVYAYVPNYGLSRAVHWEKDITNPRTFAVLFSRSGNTGNEHESYSLNNILPPSGDLQIALQASYLEMPNAPGFVESRLYGVSAYYMTEVPEPATGSLILPALLIGAVLPQVRRRTLRLELTERELSEH
jgi:hypothetical protein